MPHSNLGESLYLAALKREYPEFTESLNILNDQHRQVLLERLKGKSLLEVALKLPRRCGGTGVTRERVRQIEAKACRRLMGRGRKIAEAMKGPGSSEFIKACGYLKE